MAGGVATRRAIDEVRFRADKDGCLPAAALAGAVTAAWKESRERGDACVTMLLLDLDGPREPEPAGQRDVCDADDADDADDAVIKIAIGMLARTRKEEGWTFGRLGGDEFVLVTHGVTLEAGFLRAERLRRELETAIAQVLPKGRHCAVSIGVANLPRDARTPDELIRKANLALHAAMERGGNAVSLTPGGEMVLKSSYYSSGSLGRLRALAERQKKKEAVLLREALDDLLRKYGRF